VKGSNEKNIKNKMFSKNLTKKYKDGLVFFGIYYYEIKVD